MHFRLKTTPSIGGFHDQIFLYLGIKNRIWEWEGSNKKQFGTQFFLIPKIIIRSHQFGNEYGFIWQQPEYSIYPSWWLLTPNHSKPRQ